MEVCQAEGRPFRVKLIDLGMAALYDENKVRQYGAGENSLGRAGPCVKAACGVRGARRGFLVKVYDQHEVRHGAGKPGRAGKCTPEASL